MKLEIGRLQDSSECSSNTLLRQIDELSNCVGKFLYEKGVVDKSVVGIMMTNSVEFIVSWLAIVKLGARPALFNTNLR